MERLLWYKIGNILRRRKQAGNIDSMEIKILQSHARNMFGSTLGSDQPSPPSPNDESFSFGGLDGASESKIVSESLGQRNQSSHRPTQINPQINRATTAPNTPTIHSKHKGMRQSSRPHQREFAKRWVQSQIQRAQSLPDHLKTNEDRLLEWLGTDFDDETAPLSKEVASFTMRMFGLLRPSGALGGVFAPGGAMAAHSGTYLAAQSAVLGILPAVGLSKCNCMHCDKEIGRLGSGVWWRCQSCPMNKSYICGHCFTKGMKCGVVEKNNTQAFHPAEHMLLRCGHTTSLENFHFSTQHEWQLGMADLTSDNEPSSQSPERERRTKSESYTEAEVHPASLPTSLTTDGRDIKPTLAKSKSLKSPVLPKAGHAEHESPPRKYSPPPHMPKQRTDSVSSLLPAIPTPRPPSPPVQKDIRTRSVAAARLHASGDQSREGGSALSAKISGKFDNGSRETELELPLSNASKPHIGVAGHSASTLGQNRGDEQENIIGSFDTKESHSPHSSIGSSASSQCMLNAMGGNRIGSLGRGSTGSPAPSELMTFEIDHDYDSKAAASDAGRPSSIARRNEIKRKNDAIERHSTKAVDRPPVGKGIHTTETSADDRIAGGNTREFSVESSTQSRQSQIPAGGNGATRARRFEI